MKHLYNRFSERDFSSRFVYQNKTVETTTESPLEIAMKDMANKHEEDYSKLKTNKEKVKYLENLKSLFEKKIPEIPENESGKELKQALENKIVQMESRIQELYRNVLSKKEKSQVFLEQLKGVKEVSEKDKILEINQSDSHFKSMIFDENIKNIPFFSSEENRVFGRLKNGMGISISYNENIIFVVIQDKKGEINEFKLIKGEDIPLDLKKVLLAIETEKSENDRINKVAEITKKYLDMFREFSDEWSYEDEKSTFKEFDSDIKLTMNEGENIYYNENIYTINCVDFEKKYFSCSKSINFIDWNDLTFEELLTLNEELWKLLQNISEKKKEDIESAIEISKEIENEFLEIPESGEIIFANDIKKLDTKISEFKKQIAEKQKEIEESDKKLKGLSAGGDASKIYKHINEKDYDFNGTGSDEDKYRKEFAKKILAISKELGVRVPNIGEFDQIMKEILDGDDVPYGSSIYYAQETNDTINENTLTVVHNWIKENLVSKKEMAERISKKKIEEKTKIENALKSTEDLKNILSKTKRRNTVSGGKFVLNKETSMKVLNEKFWIYDKKLVKLGEDKNTILVKKKEENFILKNNENSVELYSKESILDSDSTTIRLNTGIKNNFFLPKNKAKDGIWNGYIDSDVFSVLEKLENLFAIKVLGAEKYLEKYGEKYFNIVKNQIEENLEINEIKDYIDTAINQINTTDFEAEVNDRDDFVNEEYEDNWSYFQKFMYRREKQVPGIKDFIIKKLQEYKNELE